MGGNAVVAYRQQFDLEGDSGMVARGIGTVVSLAERGESSPPATTPQRDMLSREVSARMEVRVDSEGAADNDSPHTVPAPAPTPALGPLPLITMCKFPPGFVTRLGGGPVVQARSHHRRCGGGPLHQACRPHR